MRARMRRIRAIAAAKSTLNILWDLCTKIFRVAHVRIKPGCPKNAFRRDTARIQTSAAQQIALDERYFRAQRSRGAGCQHSRWSSTKNHQVVFVRRIVDSAKRLKEASSNNLWSS